MAGEKTLFSHWWFWVGLLVLVVATWQASDYIGWKADMAKYDERNRIANEYWATQQKLIADNEAANKADTYGGATPEETLRLFVEALEKRDYVLASKYFVAEEWKNQEDYLKDGLPLVVKAYRGGGTVSVERGDQISIIELRTPDSKYPFGFRFVKNKFTNKWKLTDK